MAIVRKRETKALLLRDYFLLNLEDMCQHIRNFGRFPIFSQANFELKSLPIYILDNVRVLS